MMGYVKNILERTKESSSRFPFRDRWQHTLRVCKWAERINRVEKGDPQVVAIAAIFHDVGKGLHPDRPHAEVSAEICEKYLRKVSLPEAKIQDIVQAVRCHSLKNEDPQGFTLEQRIIMDADSLDEVGALCVLWDALGNSNEPQTTYRSVYCHIKGSYDERLRKMDTLKTEEGRRLYQKRLDTLGGFIQELALELGLDES